MTQPAAPLYAPDGTPAEYASTDDATAALKSGEATVPLGVKIHLTGPDGGLYNVDSGELDQALQAGYSLAPKDVVDQAQLDKANEEMSGLEKAKKYAGYGALALGLANPATTALTYLSLAGGATTGVGVPNVEGGLIAGALGGKGGQAFREGVLGGYSMGLDKAVTREALDAAMGKEAGAAFEKQQDLLREVERGHYLAGEIGGSLAGAIGGGAAAEAGGIAKALAGPQALVAKFGGAAEDLAAAATSGLSKSLAAQMVAGAAKLGARGAVEGGLMNATNEISEEMLGDADLAGQKIFTAFGKGALAGLAGGAALGAAGPLASRAIDKVQEGAQSLASKYASKVEDMRGEQAFKQLSPHPKRAFTAEAEARVPGGIKAVGDEALNGIVDTSSVKAAVTNNSTAQMLERAENKLDDLGTAIGERMRGSTATIDGRDIAQIAHKLVNEADETGLPLTAQAGRGNVVKGLRDYVMDLLEKHGMVDAEGRLVPGEMSMADAFAQRRALDQKIYKDYSALEAKGPMELMRKFRGEFDDLLMRKMEQAGEAGPMGLGPQAGASLRELKDKYQKTIIAKKILEDAAVKEAKNRSVSLTDYIAGAATFGAHGNPLTGLVGAYAHKLVRETGNAVAAMTLGKIANIGAAYQAMQATNRAMEKAVDGIVAGTTSKSARATTRLLTEGQTIGQRYDRAVQTISSMAGDSQALARLADEAAKVQGAPKVGDAYAQTLTRAAAYLSNLLPPAPASTMPGQQPTRPDSSTQYRVVKALEAVTDPMHVYTQLAAGQIDLEAIEALRQIRPAEYNELRWQVIDRLSSDITKGKKFSADQRMKLFLAFDVQLTPTLAPQALAMQHAAAAAVVSESKGQPRPPARPHQGADTDPAGFDALER